MRAILQRAIDAKVSVNTQVIGEFTGPGAVILLGVTHTDSEATASKMAEKIHGLRIFDQEFISHFDHICVPPNSPRELSLGELGLPVLVISQFTLYASTKKGRRPTWDAAAPGPIAEPLVNAVSHKLRELGTEVATGQFGADMQVSLTNSGPITLIIEVE
jgi:D-aminoacyl-tRNA deacylase